MKNAETVTFGGSGLNRASELRGSDKAIPRDGDLFIIHWRGKFAVDLKNSCEIALLRYPNKIISDEGILYLGIENDVAYFAADISEWEPTDQDEIDGSFFDKTQQFHEFLGEYLPFWELRRFMHLVSSRSAELAATAKSLFHWQTTSRFRSKCGHEVSITASGWQINCKSCGSSTFPRIDPVVIMLITNGPRVLLGRSIGGQTACTLYSLDLWNPGKLWKHQFGGRLLKSLGLKWAV